MYDIIAKKRRHSRSAAYEMLKEAIEYLSLPPGATLVEGELVAHTGFGRSPIREALSILSEEALVDIFPQSGTYVARICPRLTRDAMYVRRLLDRNIWLAVCGAGAHLREKLDEQMYFMRTAARRNDVAGFIRQVNLLHSRMCGYAGHGLMWEVLSRPNAHLTRIMALWLRRPERIMEYYGKYEQLLQCAENGDQAGLAHVLDKCFPPGSGARLVAEIRRNHPGYFADYGVFANI